jgi:N,N'-diacetyllegionaminate synthase
MTKTFIIAEAGVNHNGSLDLALKMVDSALSAGADAVKFQTFKAEKMITATAPKAGYQKQTSDPLETQMEMVRKLELDEEAHKTLFSHCQTLGIEFISSPFDLDSIDFLDLLGMKIFKIPSGEITNLPYLKKLGGLNKHLLLSTGMANLGEIEAALDLLTGPGTPRNHITVMHCTTGYPTPFEDVNLRAIKTIRHAFPGISVGYSDHTRGIETAVAAVAMGAEVIEKHFTLDKRLPGPDHQASLEPEELAAMVTGIRNMEISLGSGIKKPTPTDLANIPIVRKSIVAAGPIAKGEMFTEKNITSKRPGTGISPMRWDEMIGRRANRNYEQDEFIEA